MIKSLIKAILGIILTLGITLGIVLGYVVITSPEPHKSAFTHDEIAKINPVLIVDKYTFLHADNQAQEMRSALSRMVEMGIVIMTPFGPVVNPDLKQGNYSIPVIIQSGGGLVSLGMELIGALNSLREAGVKVNCYVGEAQSMAFALMVIICDKVIAKKSARLMQHRVSYGTQGTTPHTFQSDIELSRLEAESLGVNYDEWHNLARGPEDHVFTKEEIEKYKLVDEWID